MWTGASLVEPRDLLGHHGAIGEYGPLGTLGPIGSSAAVSATGDAIDWVQVRVPAGARLSIRVTLAAAWSAWWRPYLPRYRLFVVGSTRYRDDIPHGGAHLERL